MGSLKRALTSAPILTVPDPSTDFMVCTDASLDGIGAVLMQDGRPISFESRKLKTHELNYPTHDLELATLMLGREGGWSSFVSMILMFITSRGRRM